MKLRFGQLISVLVLVSFGTPARAQSTAGAANLQIPPDVRAEGMGRVWAPLATTPYAAWSNVGGLGLLEGVQFARMHAQLVPDLAEDVYFDYTSIVAGYSPIPGVPLNFSIGYNRTDLDYGISVLTGPGSPDPIGTFNSTENTDGVTLAVGVGSLVGIGIGLKTTEVNLAPGSDGKASARDIGILARTPYLVYDAEAPEAFAVSTRAGGQASLRLLGALAWSNHGDPISLVPNRQSDPLPEVRREAVGVELNVMPLHRVTTFQSRLLKRLTRDAHVLTVSAGLGLDDSMVDEAIPDSIAARLSKNDREGIVTYKGFEIRLFDVFSYRRGSIFDDPGEIKGTTTGWGLSFFGVLGFDRAEIPQYKELQRVKKSSFWVRVPLDGW